MVKFEQISKDFTYLGLKYRSHNMSFRLKNLDKTLELAKKWMIEHYGTKFLGFEFRPDFNNSYISRIDDRHLMGSHLNDNCSVQRIGTQWRASLYYRQPIF